MDNNKEDLVPVEIDLGMHRRGKLEEDYLAQMGSWIEAILTNMFRGSVLPINIKGNKSEVRSFANALQQEKKFIEAYHESGFDSPETFKSKANLQKATSKFERTTGLKWPFK